MLTSRVAFGLALFALVFSPAVPAHGQVVTGGGIGSGSAGAGYGPHIELYTSVHKTTQVQKLADGTTITRETTVKEAHDSSGRTYRESRSGFPAGLEEQAPQTVMFSVSDPENRIVINWNSNSKEAHAVHMYPMEPVQTPRVQPPATSSAAPPQVVQRPVQPKPNIEKLGTRTINGFEAEGTRTTRIIPVGMEGNDRPMTVTNEIWRSAELKMIVMSIIDDPRTGTNTTELTSFERGEPDPALFQVPEGYTVIDRFPNQPN